MIQTKLPDVQKNIEVFKPLLLTYMSGNFYESKKKRFEYVLNHPKHSLDDILMEAFYILLPLHTMTPIQGPAGQLGAYLNYDDVFDGVKTAADIFAIICKLSPLFEIVQAKNSELERMSVRCTVPYSPTINEIIKAATYLPPSITEPRKVYRNDHSGYLTQHGSLVLGKGNHHKNPLAYDAINIASNVKLELDTHVISELEPYSSDMDTTEKKLQHDAFMRESLKVFAHIIEHGNQFYFTWKFDKRGRMYSQGYHINIQSTEWHKAMINLANKEIIG